MISIFDLFKVGIGPSSSHTMGPMIAANDFVKKCSSIIPQLAIHRLTVDLFGSLALTGRGHQTDDAVLAGLAGWHPAEVEVEQMRRSLASLRQSQRLAWDAGVAIEFIESRDLRFHGDQSLAFHPNALCLSAWDRQGELLLTHTYYSIGGGFVVRDDQLPASSTVVPSAKACPVPFDFRNAAELLAMCAEHRLSMAEVVERNEAAWRTPSEIAAGLDRLWVAMRDCIRRGCQTDGILPGGLGLARRAPRMARALGCVPSRILEESDTLAASSPPLADPAQVFDWVSLFALAVNEENAAGGRVVTAPTNGAAGIIPAVLGYYLHFHRQSGRGCVHTFLKTAGAIGLLYKRNASLSAAEMGCQGEVGVACSMAAAGLAACLGGTPPQIEHAAEIGMEHCLGLTCDPVLGLVQIPCIERNTMGAAKAINAARLAVLYGDGRHRVSLDKVIETMRQTGVDMQAKYKETSLGGLAVNAVNC
jgi:L-serine dehydratase